MFMVVVNSTAAPLTSSHADDRLVRRDRDVERQHIGHSGHRETGAEVDQRRRVGGVDRYQMQRVCVPALSNDRFRVCRAI